MIGRCVLDSEINVLFKALFNDTVTEHHVAPGQLTLHADRGGPTKAKVAAMLLSNFSVTRSQNRPHSSNDNRLPEGHFATLKYRLRSPRCFGCIDEVKSFCRGFFDWYNQDHLHGGIRLMTPDQVHYGQLHAFHAARQPSRRMDLFTTAEQSDLNEGPDDIDHLSTLCVARRNRIPQPQSGSRSRYASLLRFIGFHYATPQGLPMWPAEDLGRPPQRDVPKILPEMTRLISGKPVSQALNSDPGVSKSLGRSDALVNSSDFRNQI